MCDGLGAGREFLISNKWGSLTLSILRAWAIPMTCSCLALDPEKPNLAVPHSRTNRPSVSAPSTGPRKYKTADGRTHAPRKGVWHHHGMAVCIIWPGQPTEKHRHMDRLECWKNAAARRAISLYNARLVQTLLYLLGERSHRWKTIGQCLFCTVIGQANILSFKTMI